MTLTAVHVFACIVATLATQFGGLDALAIETAGRGGLVATGRLAHPGAPGIVKALPVTTVAPLAEIPGVSHLLHKALLGMISVLFLAES